MVNRNARDIAADVLRQFMEGSISNKEYEQKYPRSKDDPALWEIWVQVWFFYSDVKTHNLTGKHALNDECRAFIERCILFLKSNAEFEWPPEVSSLVRHPPASWVWTNSQAAGRGGDEHRRQGCVAVSQEGAVRTDGPPMTRARIAGAVLLVLLAVGLGSKILRVVPDSF